MGEVMLGYAIYKQIAGLVIDGPIRDSDAVEAMSMLFTQTVPIRQALTKMAPVKSTRQSLAAAFP